MSQLECINPFSGATTGSFHLEDLDEQTSKISKLKEAQSKWKRVSLDERISLVKNALQYFEDNRDLISKDITEQMGRPLHYSGGEVNGFFERANYLCSIAKETLSAEVLLEKKGFDRSIEHAPLGVIFVISAWNFPLLISVNSIVPALIAGNTVLLKHSGLTPKIGEHFEKAFKQMGGNTDLLYNSVITHEVTGKVIENLPIDHVIFTGSVNGGRQILKHSSAKFIAPALELGGKDAAYVHSDADLDHASAAVVDGGVFNSGQSCCGIERVYVHEAIYDAFLEKARRLVEEYKMGDPLDSSTTLGPLASAKAADSMEAQIEDALKKGAKVLLGGKKEIIESGTFFQATLVTEVDHGMDIMKEENFGPILPVMKVSSVDEAISYINDSDYGLTCAIFTKDKSVAQKVAREADTGTVFMNRCDYLDPALPWTGVKNSGVGSSLSKYGFYGVTRRKSIHFKTEL